MGKKPIVPVTYENEGISIIIIKKKQLTSLRIFVKSLLCGPQADLWPFYGLQCKRFSLYKSTRGPQRRDVTNILRLMFIVPGYREAAFLLKTVKRMLYLGYVLLRYVLIYNLEVPFNFHLTFLQLDVIKGNLHFNKKITLNHRK